MSNYRIFVERYQRADCGRCGEPATRTILDRPYGKAVGFACEDHWNHALHAANGAATLPDRPDSGMEWKRVEPDSLRAFQDGNMIAVVAPDFVNIQESGVISWLPALAHFETATEGPSS